ncbi:Spindle and kinetochore-associated protein 1 [Pleodorina starrii]|uniref:Spindle and kinetochore-associated protein 1 n=1 Tax=Pleodorina starrii TaxID=330485 RepID=A0A9W6B9S8_9CHLO|nr:Spindle and kinetochore-associated protein 1 [Pleodorina starrii]GLC48152.1 Spindle and kinetochore-associated protein 1 [Pleodorina starrii]GLC67399.1 Spindle and kinetochore-associated protein 1 [Pleodorina starrii]
MYDNQIHVELVHKHIVMLYAAFQKRLVLVQEYAGRGDLYGIYRSLNRRMTEAQLTHLVLAPFMEALAYLHARGICHRDVKPENILFTNDWRLLIADFGVSIDLNQERAVTRAGTLEYMAPEVERCPLKMLPEENKDNPQLAYTTAVDIWAVGVLAYELMVGFPPVVVDSAPGSADAGAGGHGPGGAFLAEHATRKTLSFPASTSPHAHDFISAALAERPEERPTAVQLSRHPWLAGAAQQPAPRRSAGQLNSLNGAPLYPSRLGASSLASAPSSGGVPSSALVL